MTDPTTTILLSPAAGGKTERLVQLLVEHPQSIRPRWAVLPDRMQVSTFRRRIAQAGGALGVSVGTFGDLFQEILARAGHPVAVTPEPARLRILRLALRELGENGELSYYKPIARTPGFLTAMGDIIAELKRARVAPIQVRESEGASIQEIGLIFEGYESRLRAIHWTDREGLSDLAIESLNDHPALISDMPLVAVDGFDYFDAAQLEALQAISKQAGQLVITLPGGVESGRPALKRFARPLARLRKALAEAVLEELADPGALPDVLRKLEAGLFNLDAAPFDPEGSIEMIETRSPADEAREAIRWIKARLIRDQIALEDCALITPDLDQYGPLLRRAAAEFGVSLRFPHGKPLHQAPSVAALLDLLELSRSNWPRRLTLQSVRSPYFDLSKWDLGSEKAIALDAASHAGQVVEGLDQWERALTQLMRADPEVDEPDDQLPAFSPPKGLKAEYLLKGLQGLAKRLAPAVDRPTSKWVEWLENLLDDLDFAERTSDKHDHPAFLRLRETLRALVLGEILGGQIELGYAEFLVELHTAIESATYRDGQPLYEPSVNVLRPLEARGGRYHAVVVMGLSEGLLPKVEREDPFLSEATRATLGLELRLGLEQGGLFYQAATRADARLLFTRAYLADDGELWEASPFWVAVERLLVESKRRIRPAAPRPLQEAASPQELIFWGVRRGGIPASLLEAQMERWEQLQHAQRVLVARGESKPAGPYEGDLDSQSLELEARYGPDHLWSPSRLETYGTCPHMFYASHLLKLETRESPEAGLDAAQLGLVLHEILEESYARASDPSDVDSVLESVDRVVGPIMDRAPEKYGFRPTPLWQIERGQYEEALKETIRALAEAGEGWVPSKFELRFGFDPGTELELPANGRKVRIRGLIDRLDTREDGRIRVIDYKSGSSRLSARELDEGRRVQLPLYALAAQEALSLGQVVEGFYWAILAAKRGSLRLSNYRAPEDDGAVGPGAAYGTARRHVERIVDGVAAGRFEPVPPPGGCPDYCPAAAWCWRYRPRAGSS